MNATLLAILDTNFPGWQQSKQIQDLPEFEELLLEYAYRMLMPVPYTIRQVLWFTSVKYPLCQTVT